MFGGYPPTAIGYPPTAIGYTPTAINYPPAAIGYTPTAISYPPTAIGYPPTAISYPPAAIIGRIGHSEFFFIIMATPGFYGGHSTGYKLGNHPKNIEPCAHRARTVRAPCAHRATTPPQSDKINPCVVIQSFTKATSRLHKKRRWWQHKLHWYVHRNSTKLDRVGVGILGKFWHPSQELTSLLEV